MPSSGTLSRSTASLLRVAAAACGESPTEFGARAARQRGATEFPTSALSGITTPPTLEIRSSSGNGPLSEHTPPAKNPCDYYCGPFWRVEVYGTGFAPRHDWKLVFMYVLPGGMVIDGGGGSGVDPKDGTIRMAVSASCPVHIREVYAVAAWDGKRMETKRVKPTC